MIKPNMPEVFSTNELLDKLSVNAEQLSLEELQLLYDIFKSEEHKRYIEAWMFQKWDRAAEEPRMDFEGLMNRVERRLDEKQTKKRTLAPALIKYAAILFIPLLCAFSVLLVKMITPDDPVEFAKASAVEQEYISPVGMRSKLTLSDSTVVWLNADSRLIVAAGFNQQTRNVRLIGEAFFEVRKKADNMAFVVSTPEIDIKVLGTSFNVSAYPDSPTLTAALVEGKIEATSRSAQCDKVTERQIVADQVLTLKRDDNTIDVKDGVDTEFYTSWKTGKLIFNSTPIDEIARTLERCFNVSVILHDPEIKLYKYSGTFDNRSIGQIMKYLELSSPIYYKIDNEIINVYIKK